MNVAKFAGTLGHCTVNNYWQRPRSHPMRVRELKHVCEVKKRERLGRYEALGSFAQMVGLVCHWGWWNNESCVGRLGVRA